MASPSETYSVAFELDTRRQPPLHLVIRRGHLDAVVDEPLENSDPSFFKTPGLSVPGGRQGNQGEELERVAQKFQAVLGKEKLKPFTLVPEEQSHVTVDRASGHQEAIVPASSEVLFFIAKTVALLGKAKKV